MRAAGSSSGFLQTLRSFPPKAIAVIEPNGPTLTFSEIQSRISSISQVIRQHGISTNEVVALILPNGADLIASFLGVCSVACCAILNPNLTIRETQSALADLDARAVIIDPARSSFAAELTAASGILSLGIESGIAAEQPAAPSPDQVALVLHTSGTTAKPRIVPLTHANLGAMAGNSLSILNLTPADRFLSMMPLFHLHGLMSVLAQMLAGGAVIFTRGFEASQFPQWLEEYRPTWYTAGPTLHHSILQLVELQPDMLGRAPIRFVRSLGAPLPEPLLEQLEGALRAPVLEDDGMTEAGLIASNTPLHNKRGSVGRSTGVEIAITTESGLGLPTESEGEIVIRGPAVMRAYHNDPEANHDAFRNGWFRTGDLGRIDRDEFLFVTGRIKDIINRGGEKILPSEVENAMLAHPAVSEADNLARGRQGVDHVAARGRNL